MGLEHQALTYKCITESMLVPSNLLIPIRKYLDSFEFSTFQGALMRPSTCRFLPLLTALDGSVWRTRGQ
ncbi:hypothetical protein I3842_06G029600 [Carya illinoinensis]|uniref:QLQ domain-containing protein n=1 Tax=Carya illinoinensis TaxID=32201 RepID=A0A922JH11_CARIL|nr:hypothetical protein I3842_06G029600 [Carya illinoinensis]